jgi:hypothetical protein
MDYAFCLLTLKSSEKWRSPLFVATCNFNDQVLRFSVIGGGGHGFFPKNILIPNVAEKNILILVEEKKRI